MSDPAGPPADPRALLARHGLEPKKAFGQNFLVNRNAVARIAELAAPVPGTTVIEIGAGLGTLTVALLDRDATVIAVERDRDMCRVLRAELADRPGFTLAEADAATFDYARALGTGPATIAGNLPYNITGRIVRRVIDLPLPPRAVLMVQEEVARRFVAPPGDEARSTLSVLVQARFRPRIALRLGPESFSPRPKIRSAVVELSPLPAPAYGDLPAGAFDRIVRAAFAARRKQIHNSLAQALGLPADRIAGALVVAQIDARARAEDLPLARFVDLARALSRD